MRNFAVLRYKFTFLAVIFLFACADRAPLRHGKMVDIFTDAMILEGGNQVRYNFANVPSYVWNRDYMFVCKKHGVDTADFKKELKYLEKHPAEFSTIMEEVITRLQQQEAKRKPKS